MAKPFVVSVVNELPEREGEEKRNYWTRVGVAFPHRQGGGFNVEITPGLSVSGKLVIMPPKEDEPQQ